MASLVVWLLILIFGGIGGIVICSVFEGNEVFSGYAAMLGMIIALLSAIFFQLNLMH
ncbi:hypothetical protein J2Y73_003169 [Peribacillus frigoritolerans]|uniref:hypothetical protein n=1 Tax=Peribacillus frigoritolerans TaxID=450367 RepID=UPI00209D6A5A|nr:hypothetical protein [Peribacillus frigoritolerans]MCP1493138.1 hypothetical protein [Peribacillus frigoritolerans]